LIYSLLLIAVLAVPALVLESCVPAQGEYTGEVLSTERLVKKLEANRRRVRNFIGYGNLSVDSPEISNSARFSVKVIRPDSLYMEILGPFNIELAQAVVTKTNFVFYDSFNDVVYTGSSDSDVLNRIFKVDVSFDEIMDAFTGAVNLTSKLHEEPTSSGFEGNKYILTYVDSLENTSTTIHVDAETFAVTDYESFNGGKKVMEGIYSDVRRVDGLPVPHKTKIKSGNNKIEIFYKNIEINKDDLKIAIDIPSDARIIEWK
jgi:outer membrane lipoprotein-sorting protein